MYKILKKTLTIFGLYEYFSLLNSKIPKKFIKKVRTEAKKKGVKITVHEIKEIYFSVDKKENFLSAYFDAVKAGVTLSLADAIKIFESRKDEKANFKDLLAHIVKAKNKDVVFSVEDLIKFYKEDRNLSEITSALIKAKKNSQELQGEDIKTLFYGKKDYNEMLQFLIRSKEFSLTLGASQLKTLYVKGISIDKFIDVQKMLKSAKLDIPFPDVIPLLENDVNIIAAVNILKEAKKHSEEKLKSLPYISNENAEKLANEYIIKGKDAFKKKLSDLLISLNSTEDPVLLYHKLIKEKADSFKIRLSLILEFVKYSYQADIYIVVEAYLKSRKSGCYARFKHLAKIAERNIDPVEFILAQIKSGADE